MAIDHEPDAPDMGDQAFVRGLLGTGVPLPPDADLDAPVAGVPARMPDEVWTRLERALHAEAAQREAESSGAASASNVVDFASAAERRRARTKPVAWFAIAAVGALVFGGAVVVQTVQSRTPDPVAAEAAVERSAVEVGSAAGTAATNAATTLGAATAQHASTGSPSRRVMASGVDYKPRTMADQVSDALAKIGAADEDAMSKIVAAGPTQVGKTGFTAATDTLRACIDEVVAVPGVQALIVDRASYLGADAGIILVPEGLIRPGHATSADGDPLVHVYVVSPECDPDDVMLDTTVEVD